MKPNTVVDICGLKLKNPVTVASGTFAYGEEFHNNFYDISRLGAVFTKGISLQPRLGNPTPRVVETPSGMLNAIGLQNVGLQKFIDEKLPFLSNAGATTIVNIFGETEHDYVEIASKLNEQPAVSALELNISCPNVKAGGVQFGIDPALAASVTKKVKAATKKILIVKVSPNCGNIKLMAKSLADAGADALSVINTLTGMSVDLKTRRPRIANVVAGLSGPAIKPVALRMVWESFNALKSDGHKVPIIGIGGIMNATDALEFILCGAAAVQVGTANFVNPMAAVEIIGGIEKFLVENNISDVNELVGALVA